MKKSAVLSAIRESTVDELKDRLKRLEEELFQHRLKRYTNQLENTNLIKVARREIARVKTVLMGRRHGSEAQAAKTEASADASRLEAQKARADDEPVDATAPEELTKPEKTKPHKAAAAAKPAKAKAQAKSKKAEPKKKTKKEK